MALRFDPEIQAELILLARKVQQSGNMTVPQRGDWKTLHEVTNAKMAFFSSSSPNFLISKSGLFTIPPKTEPPLNFVGIPNRVPILV